jgi:ribose transport system substrate-binding protein
VELDLNIAVFTKNRINPAYAGARLGAEQAAMKFGARVTHYVPDVPDSPEEQVALIDRALSERPDAFVLVPVHPAAVNEAIGKINASGIPLFTFVNRLTAGRCESFVSSDDYSLAGDVVRYVFGEMDVKGNVVIVSGPADSLTSQPRVQAFRDVAGGFPQIQIVGECEGAFLREPAKLAMLEMLAGFDQIDAVLAANDSMALGVLDALDEAGRSALVAGINAVPEAIGAVKSGRMLATADFNAMDMAFIATECAVRFLHGEPVPQEIMLPVQVVHRGNCAAWDKPFEERVVPDWHRVVGGGPP